MNHIETLKLALEALESCTPGDYSTGHVIEPSYDEQAVEQAITAIREALAEQPAQEGCVRCNTPKKCALYGCSPLTWPAEQPAQQQCRTDGRCQYAIDSGAEGLGHCPKGKCVMPAQQQEPVAFPPVQFEKVAENVEVGYDMLGGVDIRLGGEFVYVHINYDYRYTHNAARKALADQIVGLLTSPQPSKPWVGLTDDEKTQVAWACGAMSADWLKFARAIEAKLREKNA